MISSSIKSIKHVRDVRYRFGLQTLMNIGNASVSSTSSSNFRLSNNLQTRSIRHLTTISEKDANLKTLISRFEHPQTLRSQLDELLSSSDSKRRELLLELCELETAALNKFLPKISDEISSFSQLLNSSSSSNSNAELLSAIRRLSTSTHSATVEPFENLVNKLLTNESGDGLSLLLDVRMHLLKEISLESTTQSLSPQLQQLKQLDRYLRMILQL
jgi:hypothetical protein